ncbi:hypothetical protein GCM10020331_031850 [Ectobacillus funiculus]
MKHYFILDERLGIEVPDLQEDWDKNTKARSAAHFTEMGKHTRTYS